ncbi:Na/Pi cotransporter family protein [Chloroflexota bacterium]
MTEILFYAVGGLALFLFGLVTLSDGLKKAASDQLRNLLEKFTGKPYRGLLVGAAITCLIQSSSAMTALLVGVVNAGLLRLRQAIGVILGANIGTTFTAWIVSLIAVFALFKVTHYILPIIAIGLAAMYFWRTTKGRGYGRALFGFGILLLGLSYMKDASAPLQEIGIIEQWFASVHPLLAIPMGMVACWIVQSSSATIAIIQILAFQGIIPFPIALALALGADMGTPITAEIAALTGNRVARQTARAHTTFNLLGPIYMIPLIGFGIYPSFIDSIIPGTISETNIMFHIAVSHTVYNVFSALLFLPMVGILEKFSIKATEFSDKLGSRVVRLATRGSVTWPQNEVTFSPLKLEKRLLNMPTAAVARVTQGMITMLILSREAVQKAVQTLFTRNTSLVPEISQREETIDIFQKELTEYLAALIRTSNEPEVSSKIPTLVHNINDIEKIGDYAEDIALIAQHLIEENIHFSQEALIELKTVFYEVDKMTKETIRALQDDNKIIAENLLTREEEIGRLCEDFREENVKRVKEGTCSFSAIIYFLDFLTKFEKIGSHLINISEGIVGGVTDKKRH